MDDAVHARGGLWPRYDANVDEYDDGVCIDVDVDDDGPIQTCPRHRNRDGDVDVDDNDPTTATTDAAMTTTNNIASVNATRIS